VTRYISGRPFSREEVWARLLRYIGHWAALGYGFWAVEEKATGAYAGELGFADFQREIDPPFDVPEAGWAFATRLRGQGIATEALRAVLSWADANLPAPRTVCLIHPENAASLSVAAKCGFREQRRAMYKGSETRVLARERISPST
jgi:RimJ/RimL family protein N-acetyltransferase